MMTRFLLFHQTQDTTRSLQVALQGVVTQYELDKLVGLASEEPFWCYYSDDLYNELKRLRAMDLARHNEGTGLRNMRDWYRDKNEQFDLKGFFHITQAGAEYLVLRQGITSLPDDQE